MTELSENKKYDMLEHDHDDCFIRGAFSSLLKVDAFMKYYREANKGNPRGLPELSWEALDVDANLPASPVAEGDSQCPGCHFVNRNHRHDCPARTHWCLTCKKWMPIKHEHPVEVGSMETGKSADKVLSLSDTIKGVEEMAEIIQWQEREIERLKAKLATLSVTEGVDGWIDCKQELPPDSGAGKLFLTYSEDWGMNINTYEIKGIYRGFDWAGGCIPDRTTTHWKRILPPQSSLDATKGEG